MRVQAELHPEKTGSGDVGDTAWSLGKCSPIFQNETDNFAKPQVTMAR